MSSASKHPLSPSQDFPAPLAIGLTESSVRYRIDDADILLRARIRRSLSETGRQQLTRIKVTAAAGCVTLQGSVPSYYMKQIAHQAAMTVEGLQQLDSQLTVDRD